jgi:hypothetical protein
MFVLDNEDVKAQQAFIMRVTQRVTAGPTAGPARQERESELVSMFE